jgi:hypothetical protein
MKLYVYKQILKVLKRNIPNNDNEYTDIVRDYFFPNFSYKLLSYVCINTVKKNSGIQIKKLEQYEPEKRVYTLDDGQRIMLTF